MHWFDKVQEGLEYKVIPLDIKFMRRGYTHKLKYRLNDHEVEFQFNLSGGRCYAGVCDVTGNILTSCPLMTGQNALKYCHDPILRDTQLFGFTNVRLEHDAVGPENIEQIEVRLYGRKMELLSENSKTESLRLECIFPHENPDWKKVKSYLVEHEVEALRINQIMKKEQSVCMILVEGWSPNHIGQIYGVIAGCEDAVGNFGIHTFLLDRDRLTPQIVLGGWIKPYDHQKLLEYMVWQFITVTINSNERWPCLYYKMKSKTDVFGATLRRKSTFRKKRWSQLLRKNTVWKAFPFFRFMYGTVVLIAAFGIYAFLIAKFPLEMIWESWGLLFNVLGALWLVIPLIKPDDIIEQLADEWERVASSVNRRQVKDSTENKRMGMVGSILLVLGFLIQFLSMVF